MLQSLFLHPEHPFLFVAFDQSMDGQAEFADEEMDPLKVITLAGEEKVGGVFFQKSTAEHYYSGTSYAGKLPLFLMMNGRQEITIDNEVYSPLSCSVSEVHTLQATGVGLTISFGSSFENRIKDDFTQIAKEARQSGLLLLVRIVQSTSLSLHELAEKIHFLDTDIVQLSYSTNKDQLANLRALLSPKKVLISLSRYENDESFLVRCQEITKHVDGVVIGPSVFASPDPRLLTKKIKEIIVNS